MCFSDEWMKLEQLKVSIIAHNRLSFHSLLSSEMLEQCFSEYDVFQSIQLDPSNL